MPETRLLVKFRMFRVPNWLFEVISYSFGIIFRPDSGSPNPSSAGFGRPSQIRVRPDSGGRPKSEFGRIRTDGDRVCGIMHPYESEVFAKLANQSHPNRTPKQVKSN